MEAIIVPQVKKTCIHSEKKDRIYSYAI